jgi:hypothetical protein
VAEPNDIFRNDAADNRNQGFSNPLHLLPDWQMFAIFMRFLDAPQPVPWSASAQIGQQLFGTDAQSGNWLRGLPYRDYNYAAAKRDRGAAESDSAPVL